MILSYDCEFGQPLVLNVLAHVRGNVEAECIEFLSALPSEWRLTTSAGQPLTDWQTGYREGQNDYLRGFHDLQRSHRGGTRGLPVTDAILETRGIGATIVLLWPREGTFRALSENVSITCATDAA